MSAVPFATFSNSGRICFYADRLRWISGDVELPEPADCGCDHDCCCADHGTACEGHEEDQ